MQAIEWGKGPGMRLTTQSRQAAAWKLIREVSIEGERSNLHLLLTLYVAVKRDQSRRSLVDGPSDSSPLSLSPTV